MLDPPHTPVQVNTPVVLVRLSKPQLTGSFVNGYFRPRMYPELETSFQLEIRGRNTGNVMTVMVAEEILEKSVGVQKAKVWPQWEGAFDEKLLGNSGESQKSIH